MYAPATPAGDTTLSIHSADLICRLAEAEAYLQDARSGDIDIISDSGDDLVMLLRQTRECLREKELHLRTLVAQTSTLLYELSPDGTILFINDAVQHLLGYIPHELIGKKWWTVCVPDIGQDRLDELIRTLHEKVADHDFMLKCKDGGKKRLLISTTIRYGHDGSVERIVGHGVEVVGGQVFADASQGEISYITNALDNVQAAVLVIDADTWIIRSCNSAIEDILGFRRDEVVGETFEILHVDSRHYRRFIKRVDRGISGNGIHRLEYYLRLKNGSRIIAEITLTDHGMGRSLVCIIHDITERKRSQRALKESEERWRQVLDVAQVGLILVDPETHKIIDANAMAVQLIDISVGDIIGKDCHEYMCPRAECGCLGTDDHNNTRNVECMLITAGGRELPIIKYVTPMSVGGRKVLLETFIDISERKKAADILKRYQLLSENAQDIILFVRRDGSIIDANAAAVRSYGYEYEELLTLNVRSLRTPDCALQVEEQIRVADMTGITFETEHQRRDGSVFPVEVSSQGANVGDDRILLSIVRDITERKRTEQSLRESQHFAHQVTEATPDLLYMYDLEEERNVWTNRQISSILGYSDEEIRHMGEKMMANILHPEDGEKVMAHHKGFVSAKDGEIREITYRMRDLNGRWRWLASRDKIFSRDSRGLPKLILGAARDITDRRATENALLDSQSKILRHTSQSEAMVRISSELNAQLDLSTVLQLVCDNAVRSLNAPIASVMLYDEDLGVLRHVLSRGSRPNGFAADLLPITPESLGDVIFDPDSVLVIPDARERKSSPNRQLYVDNDLSTVVMAGLLRNGSLIGTLNITMFGETREFAEDELSLFRGLAHQAAQAIANAQLFQDASRRLNFLQALRDIDKAISASMDLDVILGVLLNQVVSQLGVHAADVLLYDSYSQTLEYASGIGFKTRALRNTNLRLGHGYAGRAAQTRKLVKVSDLTHEQNEMTAAPLFKLEGFVTYYSVPLVAKGQIQGVLEVFFRGPFSPDHEWMEFFETLAGQAAIAIDNAALFESQQNAHSELILAYDNTLEGWSRALDLRDKETEGHSLRVTDMTIRLAKAMGIGKAEIVHIRRGALLHDIGKVGIPDSILLKPGGLTDDEWLVMRHHPTSAYELLAKISFLRPALDIPYYHHERWDGKGYPHGLKGEQIPLSARIFSVVDVWDALCSDRPYRPAWTNDVAKAYIAEAAGTQFDPNVAAVFLEIVDTF